MKRLADYREYWGKGIGKSVTTDEGLSLHEELTAKYESLSIDDLAQIYRDIGGNETEVSERVDDAKTSTSAFRRFCMLMASATLSFDTFPVTA